VSSSADGCSGDLRCGPTPFASLGGRASAEARLRTQRGRVPLHVASWANASGATTRAGSAR